MQKLNAYLVAIYDDIREMFGYPAGLIRLLEKHPSIRVEMEAPKPCIAATSIVQWHELGRSPVLNYPPRVRGFLMGWKASAGNYYQSFQLVRPEYEQIGQCDITSEWECDITEIHGFSGSKSELLDFTSTDQMVETNSRDMIDSITQEKLAKNLAHREIRIIHNPDTSDYFARYQWDGRLFLMNDGGSHHCAAAKYIAARLPASVPLKGKLRSYSLNAGAIASLCRDYDMFVISDDHEISNAFHKAMEAFKATWLWHHMPHPYDGARAILLPKSEPRSMCVASTLRQAGVVDFGAYLAALATC